MFQDFDNQESSLKGVLVFCNCCHNPMENVPYTPKVQDSINGNYFFQIPLLRDIQVRTLATVIVVIDNCICNMVWWMFASDGELGMVTCDDEISKSWCT